MAPLQDRTWLLTSARAFLAFVAFVILAPGSVRATCGDYLTAAAHDHSSTMPSVLPGAAQQYAPALPKSRVPCSGPSCSSRNNVPLSPPCASVPLSVEQWGWVSHANVVAGPETFTWLVSPGAALPICYSDCIYHPPRRTRVVSC
jgi:hypothetical protein